MALAFFFRFLIGMAVGSSLNVIAFRYKPGGFLITRDILMGRSRCMACDRTLRWFELIPVLSFLAQAGRCRMCKNRLSLQYPTVEIIAGVLFVFVPMGINAPESIRWIIVGAWLAASSLFLLLALIDLREKVIPDEINIAIAALGIAVAASYWFSNTTLPLPPSFVGYYGTMLGFHDGLIANRSAAFFSVILLFGIIIAFTRGRGMGMGDLKLMAAMGILFGWPEILFIAMLSFILGAIAAVPLLFSKRKTIKDAVPFGPFIVLAAALIFFFGFDMISWYFGILNIG
ncbi:prepilin peptidase [Candidatus Wolfebacteria bacterium]|nr:prepilin peptidase [Candidatus Wolfebacteria bacterium]